MNESHEDSLLPETEYRLLLDALRAFATIVLFESHRAASEKRDLIIRNFIARATVTLESILRLWDARAYGDCWALFRTLVDRHFHLHMITVKDEFEAFEEWSFIRQYEMNNNIASDTTLTENQKAGQAKPTTEQKLRYKELKAKGVSWREPKPEEAAKSFGLPILYKFGYDYASRFLHPLATDGTFEFELLTQMGGKGDRGDQRLILHNAALSLTILLNESLLAMSVEWRGLMYDCIEGFRKALTGEGLDYRVCVARIATAGPEFEWCRPKPSRA
jgi:hypothetical protein